MSNLYDVEKAHQYLHHITHGRDRLFLPVLYVHLCGGNTDMAILLSQIVYWTGYYADKPGRNGWFYKTYDDWNRDTGITEKRIRRAIHGSEDRKTPMITLEMLGVKTKVKKANGAPTLHYTIDLNQFAMIVRAYGMACEASETGIADPISIVTDWRNGKLRIGTFDSDDSEHSMDSDESALSITDSTDKTTATTPKAASSSSKDNPNDDSLKKIVTIENMELHQQLQEVHNLVGKFRYGTRKAQEIALIQEEYNIGKPDNIWPVYVELRRVFGKHTTRMTKQEARKWFDSALELWKVSMTPRDVKALYVYVKSQATGWSDDARGGWSHGAMVSRVGEWREHVAAKAEAKQRPDYQYTADHTRDEKPKATPEELEAIRRQTLGG